MKRVYFDNAATTPLDKKVIKAMADFELEHYGNPNSIHREGQKAKALIDFARAEVAKSIFAKPQEIIFTSGATESNNFAVSGVVSHAINERQIKPHVITTLLEHQSVYNLISHLKTRGIIEATFIAPSKDGLISADKIISEIRDNTVLISAIYVSNEIGSLIPIRDIGRQLNEINLKLKNKIYFHTDAVSAFKYYNCHVEKLGVDLMTFSAHKINGPKGIGALYIKSGTKLDNLIHGGSQEYGKRPGTQNSVGIIGFAKAVELLGSTDAKLLSQQKIRKQSEYLLHEINKIPQCEINGPIGEDRSPDNVNFTIKDKDQDTVIAKLDLAGFAVSTGSACVSGSTEPSHVILSLNKNYKNPSATVRVTLGKQNSLGEIKKFVHLVNEILK